MTNDIELIRKHVLDGLRHHANEDKWPPTAIEAMVKDFDDDLISRLRYQVAEGFLLKRVTVGRFEPFGAGFLRAAIGVESPEGQYTEHNKAVSLSAYE